MQKETTVAIVAAATGIAIGASSVIIYQRFTNVPLSIGVTGSVSGSANDFRALASSLDDVKRELKELRTVIQGPSRQSSGIFPRARTHSGYLPSHSAAIVSSEDEEDFFEAIDGELVGTWRSESDVVDGSANGLVESAAVQLFVSVDQLMDGNAEQKIKAYHILYEVKSQYSKDHEFLWRLAKATHLYAQIVGERSDQEQKKQLAYKANEYACAALELRSNSADVHKWCAVTLGSLSDYVGTQQKIKNGYQFKEHCEIALKLQPKDSLVLHLLGRWCYSVAMLTWFEKKVANTLLGAPIESSVAEARNYFLKAEEIQPESWKENLLYIAKCYAAEYDYKNAADWLEKAFNMPINDTDDEVAHNEIETLLSKYR